MLLGVTTASYILFSTGYWSLAGPMLGGLVGVLIAIALILGSDIDPRGVELPNDPLDSRVPVVVASGYVLSIVTIYQFTTYEQPWVHYLVFGLYAGYVGYEITTGANRRRVVPQILVLCFFTYWSTQFAFPSGMFGPDTQLGYMPVIRSALESGAIRSHIIYLGHLVYVTEFVIVSDLPAQTAYYLLATLVLTVTMLILSVVDLTIPIRPERVILYGTMIFGCMSWTLSRGFHPNKLNFFYPLILLIGMAAFGASMYSDQPQMRWIILGILISPSIIFGHRFSAGAALVFLLTVGLFALFVSRLSGLGYERTVGKSSMLFVAAYAIALFGNPIHQGGLLDRLSRIILSIVGGSERAYASVGGLAGPGRYSQFPADFLLLNTSAQALLFTMSVIGVVIAFRRINVGFDFSIFWMGALSVFLIIALVFNSADTQPQRFYAYLALFGLNVSAGMLLVFVEESNYRILSKGTVVVLVAVFVVLSMFSPVAGLHVSPAGDKVPHFQKFQTTQDNTGIEWSDSYVRDDRLLRAVYSGSSLPQDEIDRNTVSVAHSRIPADSMYLYSEWTRTTGVNLQGGSTGIGSRGFGFLTLNEDPNDDRIYSNGKSTVYVNQ